MSVEYSTPMSQLCSEEADGIHAVGYQIREAEVSIEPKIWKITPRADSRHGNAGRNVSPVDVVCSGR